MNRPTTETPRRTASALARSCLPLASLVLGCIVSGPAFAQGGDKPPKPNPPKPEKPADPPPESGDTGPQNPTGPPKPDKPPKPEDFPGYTSKDERRDRRLSGGVPGKPSLPPALAEDDRLEWGVRLPGAARAAAVRDSKHAYAVTNDGMATAIDLESASEEWSTRLTSGPAARPALTADRLFVPLANGELVALDIVSGGVKNSSRTAGPIEAAPQYDSASGRLIVATTAGGLAAIDSKTFKVEWRSAGHAGVALLEPVVYGDHAVVVDKRGRVRACSVASGKQLWERQIIGAVATPPWIAKGARTLVLVGTVAGELSALDVTTGAVAWTTKGFGPFIGATLWGADLLTAYANGRLFVLDPATGKEREDRSLRDTPDGRPFTLGNQLFLPCVGGKIEVFDQKLRARDPLELGSDLLDGGSGAGPLLFTTERGDLYRWKGP